MADTVLLCADGSELSNRALRAGLEVLRPGARVVVAVAVDAADPMLVTGTGMAGGVMSPDELEALERARVTDGEAILGGVVADLGLEGAERRVVVGGPGSALCRLAEEIDAAAIVIGTRGRGGVKRALLGSVSDHVVRNAPCPVVVTGERGDGATDRS